MRPILAAFVLCLALIPSRAPAEPCGTTAGECPTALGFYRLALPEGHVSPGGFGTSTRSLLSVGNV